MVSPLFLKVSKEDAVIVYITAAKEALRFIGSAYVPIFSDCLEEKKSNTLCQVLFYFLQKTRRPAPYGPAVSQSLPYFHRCAVLLSAGF
jgi:hypothetical protein